MPSDKELIPTPVLDSRTEPEFIGETIWKMLGGVTVAECDRNLAIWESIRQQVESNGIQTSPLVSELTAGQTGHGHIVLLTNILRPHIETRFRFNIIPFRDRIELLRQLGVVLRPGVGATTTIRFTKVEAFLNIDVLISAGTEIATIDQAIICATVEDLIIPVGDLTGDVVAAAEAVGDRRADSGSIGIVLQALAGIESASNIAPLTGGDDPETVEAAVLRAREEMAIGEHLGSANDYISWLYFEVLRKRGRIEVFEQIFSNFTPAGLGHVVIVVMGADGFEPTSETLQAVNTTVQQRRVAGITVAVRPAGYKRFDIEADVIIRAGGDQQTLIKKAESNLRARFSPLTFPYGPGEDERSIGVSDIIGQIEDASPSGIDVLFVDGVPRVVVKINGEQVNTPVPLLLQEQPHLIGVTLTPV